MSVTGTILQPARSLRFIGAVLSFCIAISLPSSAQSPGNFDEIVAQASVAREHGETLRAIALYSQAVQLRPGWPAGWWFLGSLEYSSGNYPKARDALTHFIETAPEPGRAFGLRALCEFHSGDYQHSLADIDDALGLGGADQPVKEERLHYYQSLALTRLSRFDEALAGDAFFAQRKIATPEVMVAIGLAGLRIPSLPGDLDPDKQQLLASTGEGALRYLAGDERGGAEAFDSLYRRFPGAPGLHDLSGYFLLASNLDRAAAEFRRELELDPTSSRAEIMLAWALLMQRNASTALPHARAGAERSPEDPSAQLVLGRSLAETGDLEEAMPHLQRALQLAPRDLEVHIALADAYSRSGQRDDAQRERAECLQMTRDGVNRIALP